MRFAEGDLKNTVLLTHKNCSDGTACAVVFLRAGGLFENIYFVPAGMGVRDFWKKNEDVFQTSDRVLIVDVAPDPKTADKLEKLYANDVQVIDHHKSSLHLKDREWCHISMEKCGSFLLYDYLIDGKDEIDRWGSLYNYIKIVNDRDMWIRENPMSEQLSLFHSFYGQYRCVRLFDYRVWKNYPLITDSELNVIKVLEAKRDYYVEKNSEKPFFKEVNGLKCAYVFLDDHESLTLHRIVDRHDVDVAIGLKLTGGHVCIRTRKGVDASWFAADFGGGGHARAAGHPIDKKTLEEITDLIHE